MGTPQKLHDLALSDTGFLFDPYTGHTFSVNATGLEILRALKDGLDRDAILERLGERFDVMDEDDLARDLGDFTQSLRQSGLLPTDFEL
ncbi:MAG: HPr-rel-A system PqqD family peptide chaperone [Myxococcota bacterium]